MKTWERANLDRDPDYLETILRSLSRKGERISVDVVRDNRDLFIKALYSAFGPSFIKTRYKYQLESNEVAYSIHTIKIPDIISATGIFLKTLPKGCSERRYLASWRETLIQFFRYKTSRVNSSCLPIAIENISKTLPDHAIEEFEKILRETAAKRIYDEVCQG